MLRLAARAGRARLRRRRDGSRVGRATSTARDGGLKVDGTGKVVTSDGHPILSGFQTIPPGTTSITIAPTGDVTLQGPSGSQTFRVQLARFANPSLLEPAGRLAHPGGQRCHVVSVTELAERAPRQRLTVGLRQGPPLRSRH